MKHCVPDWDRDRGRGCGDESGGYSPDVRGVGGPVPREGHTGNELFTGAAEDVWPWWDWDLDDVSELKWADGQPRVLQAGTVSKPTTPTRTTTATATAAATPAPTPFQPADINTCGVEDFDLERWLCAAPDEGGRHPAAAGANDLAGADAIVPGSTARLPGAAESASCLLVPDVMVPVEAAPAASCSLGTGPRRRPQPRAAGEGGGCREQLRRVKRHRAQQQQHRKQYHVEELQVACGRQQGEGEQRQDDISGRCSAPANKARCRSALSERKRRDKFNQKIRTLQKLVPNCGKVDKVSILDEVISHVRQLQAQTQMHMMAGAGARLSVSPPPVIMPAPAAPMAAYMQQQFQIMAQMAAQMSQMFRMGLAGANSFFPQPPSPLINFSSPTLAADQQMMPPSGGGRSSPQ